MKAECRWCGPVWVPDELEMTVALLHEHAMSESHKTMMRLDKELDDRADHPVNRPKP